MRDNKDGGPMVVFIVIIIFILIGCLIFSYKLGEYIGEKRGGPTCASRGLYNYTPPLTCDRIYVENDGVRCCNKINGTLTCGFPLFEIK